MNKLPNLKKIQSPWLWKLERMLPLQQEPPLFSSGYCWCQMHHCGLFIGPGSHHHSQETGSVLPNAALPPPLHSEWVKKVLRICLSLPSVLSLLKTPSFDLSLLLPTGVYVLLPPQGNTFSGTRAGQSRCCPWVPLSKKQIKSYVLRVFSSTGLQMCHGPTCIPSWPSHSYDQGARCFFSCYLWLTLISFLFKGSPAPNTLSLLEIYWQLLRFCFLAASKSTIFFLPTEDKEAQ